MCTSLSQNLSFTIAITFYHSIMQYNADFAFSISKKTFSLLVTFLLAFLESMLIAFLLFYTHLCSELFAYVPAYLYNFFLAFFHFSLLLLLPLRKIFMWLILEIDFIESQLNFFNQFMFCVMSRFERCIVSHGNKRGIWCYSNANNWWFIFSDCNDL